MSDRATITFDLYDFKRCHIYNVKKEQSEVNRYKTIQETEEGQDLIQNLVNVINNIGNIDKFTEALKNYIGQYATLKGKYPNTDFKIRDIKFDYNNKECTLGDIIELSFDDNRELIKLYNGIIKQFDRVCDDLKKVFNIPCNFNKFKTFMNNLSLETISPLTIDLCNRVIKNKINSVAKTIQKRCKNQTEIDEVDICKNKFINLQDGTQLVRNELTQGLSAGDKDSAFESYKDSFKKDDNYLSLVKDEYNRNYLHYAWRHFEGVSAQNDYLEKIKARLLEYAGNDEKNIKRACTEKDVYGLTPLCHVLIDAFDNGIANDTVKIELSYILEYFEKFGVNAQLNQEELHAIYDYFQITKNIQGDKRDYQEFISKMNAYAYIPKVRNTDEKKNYDPQIKFTAKTSTEKK